MKKKNRRSFLTVLFCSLFFTMTVAFFSPMEVVLSNAGEFYFPFGNVWGFQMLVAFGAGIVLSLILFILPGRIGQIAAAVPLGLGLAAYIQAMFLNGAMVSLTGEKMKLTDGDKTINLIIWGLILLAVLLFVILLGSRKQSLTHLIIRGVSMALLAMQTFGLVGMAVTTPAQDEKPEQYLSVDGQFTMAKDKNVIEFVLDTADGTFVREMLRLFPDLYDSLGGWVYYPNATSSYSRTYPSVTYMLTGEDCRMDLPVSTYVNQAFDNSSFLKGLYKAGTDVRVFTGNPELVSANAQDYISNSSGYRYNQFENLNLPKLEENLMKIALYKSLPYQFKNQFQYNILKINISSFLRPELLSQDYSFMDPLFKDDFMIYDPMTVTDRYSKAFRFYHLFGTHPGADWNEHLESVPDVENVIWDLEFRARALRGSFSMIEEYIARMKDLGIYDQATIIVTADHGISDSTGMEYTLDRQTVSCPVMMVKYANCDISQPMRTDESPVAHEDIFATVEKALGAPVTGTGSGKALDEYSENEPRDRYYYHSAFRTDLEGEVALREYLINGDAEQLDNWHITGRWWPILYSQNSISDENFEDLPESKTKQE